MDVIQAHPDCPPFAIFCAVGLQKDGVFLQKM